MPLVMALLLPGGGDSLCRISRSNRKLHCSAVRRRCLWAMQQQQQQQQPEVASDEQHEGTVKTERGLLFAVGDAFYRSESAVGRDLGVLAAAAYKRQHGQLRALDAMCGCGVRAMRYLMQADADFVRANDACKELRPIIVQNLQNVAPTSADWDDETAEEKIGTSLDEENGGVPSSSRWVVTSQDANKLLLSCYIREDYYDLIDVDSHGGNSVFLGSALAALKRGGLVYVTSTDGFSCSKRPYKFACLTAYAQNGHPWRLTLLFSALASYGAFTRRLPFTNEIGLRMLIGGVVREAATRNMSVMPVFSHYSSHGPVFRIMLRMYRGRLHINKNYGFIAYCNLCGASETVNWDDIGQVTCSCSIKPSSYTYSGPLWTGPLHNTADIEMMSQLAKDFDWTAPLEPNRKKQQSPDTVRLTELLEIMLEESNPALPCGFLELQDIASRGKTQTPRRDTYIRFLKKEGYAVSRSHIEPNSIKTNAPIARCIEIARSLTSG